MRSPDMPATGTARIRRVSGPLVEVTEFAGAAMNDMVALGEAGIPAEVVAIRGSVVTTQAYEDTGGLAPGMTVTPLHRPLSARLAPDLLGGVFDGLLRPLSTADTWLAPGAHIRPGTRRWHFRPTVAAGDTVAAGAAVGVVCDAGPVDYRVLVPPHAHGAVRTILAEGDYDTDTVVAEVGDVQVALAQYWPVRTPRPILERSIVVDPLHTGQRVVDLLFPVVKGGTVAVPGGFGTGKTLLLQQIAKWCDADVIVYTGCGERGNEMADIVAELSELADPRTGGRLADRTVVIANTSNMPMMAREASIYTAVTVAEHFRDMGLHAVVIADSTSRWAEALRELASRLGDLPAEEGYPAYLASALAAFYERAAGVTTLGGGAGSVTIIAAVSPPGGDLTEPVTAQTERFVRCRWTLDRDLAYARHYPAVSWSASFAHDAAAIGIRYASSGDPEWTERRRQLIGVLAEADELTALTELVGASTLPADQRMTLLGGRLIRDGLLQQNALSENDSYCSPAKSAALATAVLAVVERCRATAAAGTAPERIEAIDFGPLLRAREAAGPDDIAAVAAARDKILAELGGL